MISDMLGFKDHVCAVKSCSKCPLARSEDMRLIAAGDPRGHILIVMDSPREEEIRFKVPLCYEDGLYFQKILGSVGFEFGYCMVTYCVSCVMPELRLPSEGEYGPCFSNLWKTITYFDPKLILAVGSLPTKILTKSKKTVSALQGEVLRLNKYRVMPVQHPGFIRTKATKIQVKEYKKALESARNLVFK